MHIFLYLIILLIITVCAKVLFLYPSLPDEIATHWNLHGEWNGTKSFFPQFYILSTLMTGITFLMILLPYLKLIME